MSRVRCWVQISALVARLNMCTNHRISTQRENMSSSVTQDIFYGNFLPRRRKLVSVKIEN